MSTEHFDWNAAKDFTLSLVMEYAPTELPIAELIWEEMKDYPFDTSSDILEEENFLGVGSGLVESTLFSSIVIPVIVSVLTGFVESGIEFIFKNLKDRSQKKNQPIDDATLRKIALRISIQNEKRLTK